MMKIIFYQLCLYMTLHAMEKSYESTSPLLQTIAQTYCSTIPVTLADQQLDIVEEYEPGVIPLPNTIAQLTESGYLVDPTMVTEDANAQSKVRFVKSEIVKNINVATQPLIEKFDKVLRILYDA